MEDDWFVYILECSDGSFYTGITKNIEQRLLEHNTSPKGAKYTRGRRPVSLVYSKSVESQSEALKEEYRVKGLSRLAKMDLIRVEGLM